MQQVRKIRKVAKQAPYLKSKPHEDLNLTVSYGAENTQLNYPLIEKLFFQITYSFIARVPRFSISILNSHQVLSIEVSHSGYEICVK